MALPPSVRKTHPNWAKEHYFLFPGFFDLLVWLKKEKWDFALCFRTFGQDMRSVRNEFNLFCEVRGNTYPHTLQRWLLLRFASIATVQQQQRQKLQEHQQHNNNNTTTTQQQQQLVRCSHVSPLLR
jgi:hypothetical protein